MKYPRLLHEYFDESVRRFPHKEALIFENTRYTYTHIYKMAHALSMQLQRLGLKRQDRVLIYMDNAPEVILSFYAALKAGGIFTIINPAVQLQKLSYIIHDCEPSVIIADSNKQERILQAAEKAQIQCHIIWTGPEKTDRQRTNHFPAFHWDALLSTEALNKYAPDIETDRSPNAKTLDVDLAGLIYTSGSTGDPKGVMESHHNIVSAAQSIIQYLKNTPEDIILNTLPLSFDYGLYQAIMTFLFGGTLVLEKSFIFLTRTLKLIGEEKITGFPIVPTIVAMILKTIDLRSFDLKSLRYLTNTGASFPVEHIRQFRQMLPWVDIYSMFGLTECKRISYLPPTYIDTKTDSVGKAMPNCEVFLVDEQGNILENEKTGELVVRGSNVMQGYWNAPEQTARTFRNLPGFREKLLFTGDFFRTDREGFLYFLGRKDDMIKSRGERISAKEIENIIGQVEGVAECAVFGVEDEILGQAIKAFVVKKSDSSLTSRDLLKYCSQNLEPFSIPKYLEFMDELPKTPHGKTDKKALKKKQQPKYSSNN